MKINIFEFLLGSDKNPNSINWKWSDSKMAGHFEHDNGSFYQIWTMNNNTTVRLYFHNIKMSIMKKQPLSGQWWNCKEGRILKLRNNVLFTITSSINLRLEHEYRPILIIWPLSYTAPINLSKYCPRKPNL